MGYKTRSLKHISEKMEWYFFLLGDFSNKNVINDVFNHDFDIVARRLGIKAALIKDFGGGEIREELIEMLWKKDQIKLASFILKQEKECPGLLIMNCYPKYLDDNSQIAYIPFEVLEKTYTSTNELIRDIVNLSENKNKDLIKKTSYERQVLKHISGHIGIGLGILSINF